MTLIAFGILAALVLIWWDVSKILHNIFAALSAIVLELREAKERAER
jgi:predicted outer membrane lipoprotein